MTVPNTIGVIGILISVFLCANSAWTFLQERPRYFTALALLALSWAILIVFYTDNKPQNDLYLSLTSFLFVYIGGILSLAASDIHGQDQTVGHVSYSQNLSFWLLLIIIGALSIHSCDINVPNTFDNIKVFGISTSLTFVGFLAFCRGWFDLFGRGICSVIVALVCTSYGCCTTYYVYLKHFDAEYLEHFDTPEMLMTMPWALTFAALKIILTVLLAYRLSIDTMGPGERLRPVRTFVFKQLPEWLRPVGY